MTLAPLYGRSIMRIHIHRQELRTNACRGRTCSSPVAYRPRRNERLHTTDEQQEGSRYTSPFCKSQRTFYLRRSDTAIKRRWKDRQARCNQLSAQEMFYFERAFYRFWILAIYTNRLSWDLSIPYANRNRNISDLMSFLLPCTDIEISQLWDVNALIDTMARWPTGGVYLVSSDIDAQVRALMVFC